MRLWLAPRGLHIEPAQLQDAPDLVRIHAESFYRGWPETEFTAYLSDPANSPVLIACDAARRIAGFALVRIAGDEAELLTIAVARRWRGKGVGGALLTAVLSDLTMTPVRRLFLEVEEGNVSGLALYRRLGFSEVARRAAYYPQPGAAAATALVMRRDLG